MQKARFIIAVAVFLTIAFALPFLANLLPDHTRTLANAPELISRAYIDRVVNYLVSGKKPHVVVAGSSLVIFPHVLTDGYFEKVSVPESDPVEYADFLTNYVEMAYFKRLLAEKGHFSPHSFGSVVDLGVPSLMLSDCDLLFEKLEKNEALPEIAVLFLAPRDFMDNTVAADRSLFLHEIKGRITFKELVKSSGTDTAFGNIFTAMNYGANAWAKQFRTGTKRVVLASKRLGRQKRNETPAGALSKEAALRHFYFGDGKLADLGIYKKRYNPPDYARIDEQLSALGKLLDRLKGRSVRTVVVNMPLTEENQSLIDRKAAEQISNGMKRECLSRRIAFISPAQLDSYEKSYFVDSVHLNAIGGDTLFRRLAAVLETRRQYAD